MAQAASPLDGAKVLSPSSCFPLFLSHCQNNCQIFASFLRELFSLSALLYGPFPPAYRIKGNFILIGKNVLICIDETLTVMFHASKRGSSSGIVDLSPGLTHRPLPVQSMLMTYLCIMWHFFSLYHSQNLGISDSLLQVSVCEINISVFSLNPYFRIIAAGQG